MSMPSELRVLSFNCWGLKYIAKHRVQRMRAIANVLESSDYDIIGLQELWVLDDYEHIQSKLLKSLPYSKYFYSGALGSGLAIFSKYPIQTAFVQPYSLNGSPLDVISGDWFVGKAAASALVSHPVLGLIQVINTHFHARGGEDGPEHHRAHRLTNAWEFSRLISQGSEQGHYVIAMGDLNSTPHTLPIALISQHSGAMDAWLSKHPNSSSLSELTSSPSQALRERGITCDSPLNTYTQGKPLGGYAKRFFGKRLDYIFYRKPVCPKPAISFECTSSEVRLFDKVPQCDFSFSDHFGVDATFRFEPLSITEEPSSFRDRSQREGVSATEETLRALTHYYRETRGRNRFLMTIFVICLVILVAVAVVSAWLPKSWINPIFLLFSIALSWFATTILYVGFIFGRWELNSLTNFIEELELLHAQSMIQEDSLNVN